MNTTVSIIFVEGDVGDAPRGGLALLQPHEETLARGGHGMF